MKGGWRRNEGFLLLEMLVALSVVAVMGALMSGFLGQLGTINRLETEIVSQTEIDAAAAYLKRTLENARPVRRLDAEPDENPFLVGSETSIQFAAVARKGLHSVSLRDFHIFVATSDGSNSLVHTTGPRRLSGGKPVSHGRAITILRLVERIRFDYGGQGGWSGNWKKDGELPKAVRIRIFVETGSKTLKSEAIARIL